MPFTVGTAGHIDHGKTWLVRALTGKDTDRLPEEKARGISIDLGYAPVELPDGRRVSLIDVPGHERFVRSMVAGATGIDLFLLAIDAAEGARPQTHEHLAIIRLLGIAHGVVAVTKIDAVDIETRQLAVDEAHELVPQAAVVGTSAVTGEGVDELRFALADLTAQLERRPTTGATRLFIDRVFGLRGIGTVVTGTLWSGSVGEGDKLKVDPGGPEVRVRSVQVHDEPVERAEAGQRVAAALTGVEKRHLCRGQALVEADSYPTSYRLDIALEEFDEIPDGTRLRVHHGTAELYGRIVRTNDGFAQLRLATPAIAARGDRVVLRTETTIGGGVILDPAPPRHISSERLTLLESSDPAAVVVAVIDASAEPVRRAELQRRALLPPEDLDRGLEAVVRADDWYLTRKQLAEFQRGVASALDIRTTRHPLDPGIPLAELLPAKPWASAVLSLLDVERRGAKAYAPGASAELGDRSEAATQLLAELDAAGFSPLRVDDGELARYLEDEGRLVRIGDGLAVSTAAYQEIKHLLVYECEQTGSITLARFRDLLGTGRRDAQHLLERFDSDGVTRRVGDARVIRRRGRKT